MAEFQTIGGLREALSGDNSSGCAVLKIGFKEWRKFPVTEQSSRKRVVISAAVSAGWKPRGLWPAPLDVLLVDRQNHHCFQPLLYQVATAALSPADIAWPIRSILSGQANLRVAMAMVTGIDTSRACR